MKQGETIYLDKEGNRITEEEYWKIQLGKTEETEEKEKSKKKTK